MKENKIGISKQLVPLNILFACDKPTKCPQDNQHTYGWVVQDEASIQNKVRRKSWTFQRIPNPNTQDHGRGNKILYHAHVSLQVGENRMNWQKSYIEIRARTTASKHHQSIGTPSRICGWDRRRQNTVEVRTDHVIICKKTRQSVVNKFIRPATLTGLSINSSGHNIWLERLTE